ncbi:TPA: PBECR2 nuclease fold domain-containing protein [Campylobacter coli]
MNIREFLLEKPQENNIISFLQDGASQSENQNTSEYLSNLKNEAINDFYKNKDKYAKEYEKYNFKDQNLTNPMGNISEYKRDLYDYNKNPSMNADDLSNYILDKQSKFNASKPFFADDNEVARKNNQFMRDLGDELQKSGRGKLLQDDDGSYWVQDNNGNYSKVQGSTMGNLYRGIRDNGASVALGTAGAIGGSMLGGGVGMVAGGALGASLGAGYDYYGNTKDTNQDANLKEALMLMGENAGLSLIGDAAFAGVAKGARALKNTYNMTKTGARAGKDMIDGMAVKGGNLGNRVIDKITQKDIPMIGKFTDGGLQNAETIFNNLTKNVENKKQIDELIAKENPTYLENGKPTIEILKNIVEQGLNKNNPQFIQDSAKRTSAILKNISNALQGVPTTQRREILLKSAQAYPEIGSFLDDVLKADKDASISFLNIIKGQDEVFKNKTGLNGEFDVKAWQKDNSSYKKRINNEYAQAIKSIDELNNGSIRLSKEGLAKIEEFKNNNFLEQDIKTNISNFLEDAIDKDLSAEQIFNLRSAINKQLATGNKTYNTKEAYRLVKDTLDETMIKNASDKELAKKILEDANKNYALKENFNNSYLGKIKDQETPEALAQRIANGARNINEDKDLKRAFEGMNEAERKANEKHAFNALLAKHRIEDIGYDFKNLAKDMDNVEFVSKDLKYAKEVVNVYAKIYQNNKDLIMTALASSGKKTNSSIATTTQGVFDRILISGVFARIHALVPFMKSAKEQALRNQILDALKLAKTNKEVISNLKNIKIADKEQSRIFKDALDNYIKVDKEQNKILKDALIKEGVIKGDNFFMDKADPKDNSLRFIGKNGKEYTINKDVRNEWMKTFNLKNIDDEYIPNIPKEAKIALKDREIKLTKGSLLKLIEKDRIKYIPHIKETLESPQAILKDKDDFIFIKNIDNQTYFTSIGKDYETHLTIISNSPKKQNNIKNKMKNAEVVYYNNARALPTSRASSETNQVSFSNENSTQTKPKKNLMDDIKENIKAKEVEKKNKKSVKQRLDKVSKKNTKENVGIIQTFIQPGSKNDNSLNGLPKNPLVESPYSTQPVLSKDAEPTANGANALSKGNNPNSTQTKPKKNLMEDIKENIEAKEVEKKNKKSVKQRLDEKIQDDKKASEDILKRYDDFLKENKDYNLDFLDNLDVVTREFILNAKKKTYKGKKADIPDLMRFRIEKELNIQALKEFGKNYAEYYHDGKGALQKLLIEKQGQVAGAFHRKDLGDIDLVWGEVIDKIKHKGYGLAHIIDKHPELDLKLISDIVDKGKLNNQNNIRYRIEYKNYIIGLSSEYKGNKRTFIITAFERYKG